MTWHLRSIWGRYKKRWIVGGGILVGVTILAGLSVWNIASWHDYERHYVMWHTSLYAKTNQTLALPDGTQADKNKKRSELIALENKAKEGEQVCNEYAGIYWQQFIPVIKQKIDTCNALVQSTRVFGNDLKRVVDYLAVEQQATTVLAGAIASKIDETAMKQQPQLWAAITKQLNELPYVKEFEPVSMQIKTKVASIQQLWQALVTANEARDRAKYEDTVSKLAAIYDTLGEVAHADETAFLPLVSSLEKSYQQTFK